MAIFTPLKTQKKKKKKKKEIWKPPNGGSHVANKSSPSLSSFSPFLPAVHSAEPWPSPPASSGFLPRRQLFPSPEAPSLSLQLSPLSRNSRFLSLVFSLMELAKVRLHTPMISSPYALAWDIQRVPKCRGRAAHLSRCCQSPWGTLVWEPQ